MASPPARLARLRKFLAFIADQLLQFWPPYRHEEGAEEEPKAPPACTRKRLRSSSRRRLAQYD